MPCLFIDKAGLLLPAFFTRSCCFHHELSTTSSATRATKSLYPLLILALKRLASAVQLRPLAAIILKNLGDHLGDFPVRFQPGCLPRSRGSFRFWARLSCIASKKTSEQRMSNLHLKISVASKMLPQTSRSKGLGIRG